jgi:uncharacterized membrane protein
VPVRGRQGLLPGNLAVVTGFLVSPAAAVAGTIDMWSSLPQNCRQVEEEWEGLGLIIVTAALLVAGGTWRRLSRNLPTPHAALR